MTPDPQYLPEGTIITVLEESKTLTEAAERLGCARMNLYQRAKRTDAINSALEALRARKLRARATCQICPNPVERKGAQYCSSACYWRWRRSDAS